MLLKFLLNFFVILVLTYSITLADEKIEYLVDDNLLTVNISNLNANCCSGFTIDYHINYNNGVITFTLTDTTIQKCRCTCNFDFSIKLGPLPQGKYTIQLNREDLAKYSYSRDKKFSLGRKDVYIDDPHPKSPLILEFKQSPCKNSSEIQASDESIKGGIEIFSNPAAGAVSVRFNLKESGNVNLKVLNFLGKELNDFKFKNLRNGTNTIHLDLSDLPPGMYIGKVMSGGGLLYRFKLVWSK
jgi:hypothetical protein